MLHSSSCFFTDKRSIEVSLTDDGPNSFGWKATFRLGPITIFLRDQLEVFELIQKINEAYKQYLTTTYVGGPF